MAIRPADHGVVASSGGGGPIEATGGTITTYTGYKSHKFTSSGTFTVTAGAGDIDVLIVAGGGGAGGGGWYVAGGGGAGGLRTVVASVSAGAY